MPKKWYASKTVWWNVLSGVSAILILATEMLPLTTEWIGVVLFINASVNVLLRLISNTKLTV